MQELLDAPLQQNSQLVTGQLDNGLCYVILPNAVPPERFEAHLEIHAGAPQFPAVLQVCPPLLIAALAVSSTP